MTDNTQLREGVSVGAYIEPSLKVALLNAAKANERTLSGEIRVALKRHVGAEAPSRGEASR